MKVEADDLHFDSTKVAIWEKRRAIPHTRSVLCLIEQVQAQAHLLTRDATCQVTRNCEQRCSRLLQERAGMSISISGLLPDLTEGGLCRLRRSVRHKRYQVGILRLCETLHLQCLRLICLNGSHTGYVVPGACR